MNISKSNERCVSDTVLGMLSREFEVREQVPGRHFSGKKLRIDAIVTPRDSSEWKTERPMLGIEFKDQSAFCDSFNFKDYSAWMAQCIDYANTEWEGAGIVYVFAYGCFNAVNNVKGGWMLERLCGRLGVGSLINARQNYDQLPPCLASLRFMLNGDCIWSGMDGLKKGRHWSMHRKFGSR